MDEFYALKFKDENLVIPNLLKTLEKTHSRKKIHRTTDTCVHRNHSREEKTKHQDLML